MSQVSSSSRHLHASPSARSLMAACVLALGVSALAEASGGSALVVPTSISRNISAWTLADCSGFSSLTDSGSFAGFGDWADSASISFDCEEEHRESLATQQSTLHESATDGSVLFSADVSAECFSYGLPWASDYVSAESSISFYVGLMEPTRLVLSGSLSKDLLDTSISLGAGVLIETVDGTDILWRSASVLGEPDASLALADSAVLDAGIYRIKVSAWSSGLGSPGWPTYLGGSSHASVTCVATGPADISGDGTINSIDLAKLLGDWGAVADGSPFGASADIDRDGEVGALDLAILLGAWGS